MKVILLADIKGIGKKMEVKEVAPGFAKNYLIPQKLAAIADNQSLKMREERLQGEKKSLEEIKTLIKKLETITFEFSVKTGGKGEVFGSITASEVEKAFKEKGFLGVKAVLSRPIKSLGESLVIADFGQNLKGKAKISVKPAK